MNSNHVSSASLEQVLFGADEISFITSASSMGLNFVRGTHENVTKPFC